MVARCERKRSNDLMAASRDSAAVIDSELFSRGNPRFCPPPQIVSHCCFSDSVNSVEQPWGSAQDILARQLQKAAGITMNRIPFRGGPQVVQELVAGRVEFYVSPTLAIVPQYQGKQLKILAMTSPERMKSLPEIPTGREKGIDYVRFGWLGICAAAGTPEPIIQTLHDHIAPIVATADYHTMIENGGLIGMFLTTR